MATNAGQVPVTNENELDTQNQEQETQQAQEQEAQEQQFDAAYVRKLRAEAAENRKRLRELEAKVKADEDAKLTEQERLQKRIAELEKKDSEYQQTLQERTVRYEVMLTANKLGIVDPDAAFRLLDISSLEFDEDGKPNNIEKVLKKLVSDKPYLIGSGGGSASPTNPAQGRIGGQQQFTRSQLRDHKFYQANRDAILKAAAEGRIIED